MVWCGMGKVSVWCGKGVVWVMSVVSMMEALSQGPPPAMGLVRCGEGVM